MEMFKFTDSYGNFVHAMRQDTDHVCKKMRRLVPFFHFCDVHTPLFFHISKTHFFLVSPEYSGRTNLRFVNIYLIIIYIYMLQFIFIFIYFYEDISYQYLSKEVWMRKIRVTKF